MTQPFAFHEEGGPAGDRSWGSVPPAPPRVVLAGAAASLLHLSTWLTEEGYAVQEAAAVELTPAWLEQAAVQCVLMGLWPGADPPRWPALVEWQRARPSERLLGVIASREHASEVARQAGVAFVLPLPVQTDQLCLALACGLQRPLRGEHIRQAQVVEALLAAVRTNNQQHLRRLCTSTVTYYPSATGFFAGGACPCRGQEAVVAALEGLRHRYGALRLEIQAVSPRPQGLAVEYTCWWQPRHGPWEVQTDYLLVALVEDRIQQLGVRSATQGEKPS